LEKKKMNTPFHHHQHEYSLTALRSLSVFIVLAFVLAACSPAATPVPATEVPATTAATVAPAATEAAPATSTAPADAGAQPAIIKLKIGVSPVPHGDIIKFIKDNLAEKAGLDLEIVEFTDYVQPNLALSDGSIDANYFQHVPYMEDFGKQHNLDLVAVTAVHIEPLGIYSRKITKLADLPDKAVVAIPNDATNGGRALNLLAAQGLITLKQGVGYTATVQDITDNPKKLDIKELEAAQLVRALDDVSIAVINGNYAIEAGLKPAKDALALESGQNNPYANVLTVLKGHENDEGIQRLAKLLTSPEVKKFIEDKYEGAVIPAFQ
jgi:D-methionine transport system substrate-binding protein